MSIETESRHTPFEAVLPRAPEGWFAYLILILPLPMSAHRKPQYVEMLQQLVKSLRAPSAMQRTVFLELEELHKNDAIRQIGANGRLWGPVFGLGVRPEQPAPKFLEVRGDD